MTGRWWREAGSQARPPAWIAFVGGGLPVPASEHGSEPIDNCPVNDWRFCTALRIAGRTQSRRTDHLSISVSVCASTATCANLHTKVLDRYLWIMGRCWSWRQGDVSCALRFRRECCCWQQAATSLDRWMRLVAIVTLNNAVNVMLLFRGSFVCMCVCVWKSSK